jgi:hypothetical protein
MKNTNYDAPPSPVFFISLLVPPSSIRIFASELCLCRLGVLVRLAVRFQTNINCGGSVVLEKCLSYSGNPPFVEPEDSLSFSQGPATVRIGSRRTDEQVQLFCVRYFNAEKLRYQSPTLLLHESKLLLKKYSSYNG